MSRTIMYIMFWLVFVSCGSDTKVPSDILQPAEMSNVLWDIMRSQTLGYEIARKDSSVREATEVKALSQKVFKIYKIDSTYFNKSYNWYIQHPSILKIIFDSMYVQKERENNLKIEKKMEIERKLKPEKKNMTDSL